MWCLVLILRKVREHNILSSFLNSYVLPMDMCVGEVSFQGQELNNFLNGTTIWFLKGVYLAKQYPVLI